MFMWALFPWHIWLIVMEFLNPVLMDGHKMKPEFDPLAVQMIDNKVTGDKMSASQEQNYLEHHMIRIKEEHLDHSHNLASEIICEETPLTTTLPLMKDEHEDEAWDKISKEFNSTSTNTRTPKQLRNKFESLKKDTRKSAAAERQRRLQTGGGPPTEVKPNEIFEKVRELIHLSVEGLPSIFDSDLMPEGATEPSSTDAGTGNNIAVNEYHSDSQHKSEVFEVEPDVPIISPGSTGADGVEGSFPAGLSTQHSESDDWSNYTPRMLKKRKSKPLRNALTAMRNSSPSANCGPCTRTYSISGQKLNSWVTEKTCVATLQQELLRKQFAQREKREQELHEFDLEIRKKEIEIRKAQLRSLKLDIRKKRSNIKNEEKLY
ncbi:uncharacterized protein [Periplaneta americana]|uniref:uncharacterized protein isoform X4 n=1 Tax=Periplaneta americana TaxID=6978 RepID=UPI0037E760A0